MPPHLSAKLAGLSACDRSLLIVIRAAMIELSKEGNDWLEEYVWDHMDERMTVAPGGVA